MGKLFNRGSPEFGDPDALRVDAVEYHADGGILACGIHRLQHDQQLVFALGVEQLLQRLQPCREFFQSGLGDVLVAMDE